MALPFTANLTAAQEAALVQELNQLFNEMQVKAVLRCLSNIVGVAESAAAAPATEATAGVVLQSEAVADAAVPFASLTTAADKVNELLAALRAAGVLAE